MEELFPLHRRITWMVALFLLWGSVMLFSATGVLGLQKHGSEFYYIARHCLTIVAGFALMIIASRIKLSFWEKISYPLLMIQILLVAATYVSKFGHHALGAARWLKLGPLAFQPSEGAKITLAIYFAHCLTKITERPKDASYWVAHSLPVFLLLGLVMKQPDLGTTILLTSMMVGMVFVSGAALFPLITVFGAIASVFTFLMWSSDYRRRRMLAFLNPWADPQGAGFQTIQSFISFHSGSIFGVGLGNGNSKLFFLPEVHTDFIFSLIGEELGFVGATLLLFLFIYFSYLLLRVSFQSQSRFGVLLAFGLSATLIVQIMINIGGVTGLLPVKGLPLPFISWGRSALIVNLLTIGILLGVVRQTGVSPSAEK